MHAGALQFESRLEGGDSEEEEFGLDLHDQPKRGTIAGLFAASVLCLSSVAFAQYDRNPNRPPDPNDGVSTLLPGTVIPVRTNEAINVRKGDYRVYNGTVDQDVCGDDGRLAVRRGSSVELVVRFAPDNDLILDLDSITSESPALCRMNIQFLRCLDEQ